MQALQADPRLVADTAGPRCRWEHVAKLVPNKTKAQCFKRCVACMPCWPDCCSRLLFPTAGPGCWP